MPTPNSDPAALYLSWSLLRSASFQGYWIVTLVYLVTVVGLSPFQLVFLGTAMEVTVLLSEIPTGVVADTVSRKRSLVLSHVLMGAAMAATGVFGSFWPLVASQILWGFGWTFSSGADVAWVTDELDDPRRIGRVLADAAARNLVGAALGIAAFGLLGWATSLRVAIVAAASAMVALGGFVALRFPERGFTPHRENRLAEAKAVFGAGVRLVRSDRAVLRMFAAVVLLSSGAEAYDRLWAEQLVDVGFPERPVVWFSVVSVAALLVGAVTLRALRARIEGRTGAARAFAIAGLAGAVGLVLLAQAPTPTLGVAGVLLVGGIAWTLTRAIGAIWVNRSATSDVRATVQSFLGQVESVGEIGGGLALGTLAEFASIPAALSCSAALVAAAAVVMARDRA